MIWGRMPWFRPINTSFHPQSDWSHCCPHNPTPRATSSPIHETTVGTVQPFLRGRINGIKKRRTNIVCPPALFHPTRRARIPPSVVLVDSFEPIFRLSHMDVNLFANKWSLCHRTVILHQFSCFTNNITVLAPVPAPTSCYSASSSSSSSTTAAGKRAASGAGIGSGSGAGSYPQRFQRRKVRSTRRR